MGDGLLDNFDTGPLGLGLFQPGGYFGGPTEEETALYNAQAQQVMRMLGRENELYAPLQDVLKRLPADADEAFGYDTGEIRRLYPDIQRQITNYELDPNAQGFLGRLKDERISGMMSDVDKLIGSKVSDLAKRGVISSTTAEGAMGDVGKAVMPAVSKANEDYWTAKLTLPGQNAAQRYGMASTFGSSMGDAARKRMSSLYSPLADVWGVTAGAGQITPKKPEDKSGERMAGIAELFV